LSKKNTILPEVQPRGNRRLVEDMGLCPANPKNARITEDMHKKYIPIKFPKDESSHDYIVEWWYFNGRLKDGSGAEYSFMDCLFKVDVKKVKIPFLSKVPVKEVYFSHSLLTAHKNKKSVRRIAPFSVISDDSFSKPLLYINYLNPEIKNGYVNCVIEKTGKTNYHLKNEDIDLVLTAVKKPLLEGGKGYLDFRSKNTYYYSLTNLKTKGRIKTGGKWIEVTGKSWMDHQWADAEYATDRWDWFSIQLENNIEAVFCAYHAGKEKTYLADICYADGRQEHYDAVEIIPLKKHWTSPKSKAVYPLAWKIRLPEKNIELNLTAETRNQEMLFGSINYWEGPLHVAGRFDGKKAKGNGFMELVGYPSKYTNAKYFRDEIGKTANQLAALARGTARDIIRGRVI
jgi:predicted secreted hydrolase